MFGTRELARDRHQFEEVIGVLMQSKDENKDESKDESIDENKDESKEYNLFI